MANARYWRLVGLRTAGGGDLELSELQLCDAAGRCDAGAAISCSHAAVEGAIEMLGDGLTSASVRWAGADVRCAGFFILWDLGAAKTVSGVRAGSSASSSRFIEAATLQYLDGGRWITAALMGKFPWPGASALDSTRFYADPAMSFASLFLPGFDFVDQSPSQTALTPSGGVSITSSDPLYGGASIALNGVNGILSAAANARFAFLASEDFTVAFWARKTINGGYGYDVAISSATNASASNGWFIELSSSRGFVMARSGALVFSVSANPNDGQWTHWEVSRKGGTMRAFRNGAVVWSSSNSMDFGQAGLYIGAIPGVYYPFAGQLCEVVIVKGAALHDGPFQPASLAASPMEQMSIGFGATRAITAASAPLEPAACRSAGAVRRARDMEFSGRGRVYGTTKSKGSPNTPAKSRVRLLRERDGLLAREVWSDPVTGAFEFSGVDAGTRWVVLAQDASGAFWPVAASRFEVEMMP